MKKKRNPLTGALTPTKPTPAELAKAALKAGMGPRWRKGIIDRSPAAVEYLAVIADAKRKGARITLNSLSRSMNEHLGLEVGIDTIRNYMLKQYDITWGD